MLKKHEAFDGVEWPKTPHCRRRRPCRSPHGQSVCEARAAARAAAQSNRPFAIHENVTTTPKYSSEEEQGPFGKRLRMPLTRAKHEHGMRTFAPAYAAAGQIRCTERHPGGDQPRTGPRVPRRGRRQQPVRAPQRHQHEDAPLPCDGAAAAQLLRQVQPQATDARQEHTDGVRRATTAVATTRAFSLRRRRCCWQGLQSSSLASRSYQWHRRRSSSPPTRSTPRTRTPLGTPRPRRR
jgi:hypothetical protein